MMPAIKTVLVTGGANAWRAIALHLGAHGWSVAVHYNLSQGDGGNRRHAARQGRACGRSTPICPWKKTRSG
jgi:NAD(P)-dependent dehydrogenase (short-subunit alcohol dehydrogenase family)